MKNTFCLVVLGLFGFCHSDTAFGEATYENSGVVSFMERMNIPQKSRQQRLVILPQRPNPPSRLTEALHPSFLLAYGSRQGRLPTGTTNQAPFIYLGISLITIGILFIKRRR